MSNLGELVRDKIAEIEADEIKVMTKALAVAFVAYVLERNSKDLTVEEQKKAIKVSVVACEKMQADGIQVTAYDLFNQAVKFLEK